MNYKFLINVQWNWLPVNPSRHGPIEIYFREGGQVVYNLMLYQSSYWIKYKDRLTLFDILIITILSLICATVHEIHISLITIDSLICGTVPKIYISMITIDSLISATVPEIETNSLITDVHNNKLQTSTGLFRYSWKMYSNSLTSKPSCGKLITFDRTMPDRMLSVYKLRTVICPDL